MTADDPDKLAIKLEQIAKRFLRNWDRSPDRQPLGTNIQTLLPPPGSSLRQAALIRLIVLDLPRRWSHGERVTLDDYQAHFPELGAVDQWPGELLLAELEQHKNYGPQSPLAIVMSRFPERLLELSALVPAWFVPVAEPRLASHFDAATATSDSDLVTTSTDSASAIDEATHDVVENNAVDHDVDGYDVVDHDVEDNDAVNNDAVRSDANAGAVGEEPVGGQATQRSTQPAESIRRTELSPDNESPKLVMQLTPDRLRANVGPGYKIIRKIGEGNYGEVWLAEAPGGIEVALKCIRFPIGHEINDREFRGLQLMKNMRHPFLLQVQAFWAIDNQLVIAMELADGSLGQLLEKQRRQTLPRKELMRYLSEAAEGIDYLHQQNVVHRDIKPDNILLLKGHAKVADFGLARFIDETGLSTAATQLAGSPAYMAPEVWTQKWQPASDQYSLAVTYVELRTGRLPFSSTNPYEAMQDHMHRKPNLEELAKEERRILQKAMAKNPAKRFRNCAALVDALIASEPGTAVKSNRKTTTKGVWLWLPSLVALVAVAITVLVLTLRAPVTKKVWLPDKENFAAASLAPPQHVDGRWLHERITAELPDGQLLPFVLIRVTPNGDLRSFYIMETEVPNFAFAQFARSNADSIGAESLQWSEGALAGERLLGIEGEQAQLPVVSISRDTALAFALWLGGTLPSVQQWDAAAGVGRSDWPDAGPYKTSLLSDEDYAAAQANRILSGPAAVGTTADDESIFGVRDMAGNLDEWTNDFTNPSVALQCWIRGNSYDEQARWRFDDIPKSRPRSEARASTGFRVVLRIPPL